ncbi:ribonuclease HII [Treponema sp.]|uniref:ribonuclease HII n=1 Tax=Treponema sp. TaxID=166 RepID=UPI00388D96A0
MKFKFFAGLDEAGRGPMAGPVSAACVILSPDFPVELLNDSKKLSEKKREKLFPLIKEKCCWGHAYVQHDEIDRINILQASLKAMKLAYEDMLGKLSEWCSTNGIEMIEDVKDIDAMADGTFAPDIDCKVKCEPKADGNYPAVMAASIIAKVERDHLMMEYDKKYPEYGYARHKGYPTAAHLEVIRRIGPSPIQRMSFGKDKK